MTDQFGMPMVDCRPSHEVITELRQQVKLLRDALFSIAAREMYPVQIALDALAATMPKEQ